MGPNANDYDHSYKEGHGADWYQCEGKCDSGGSHQEECGRDAIILSMKRELRSALEGLKQLQAEMARLQKAEEERLLSEKLEKEKINHLSGQVLGLHKAMSKFEDDLKLRIDASHCKIQNFEQAVVNAGNDWCTVKEVTVEIFFQLVNVLCTIYERSYIYFLNLLNLFRYTIPVVYLFIIPL